MTSFGILCASSFYANISPSDGPSRYHYARSQVDEFSAPWLKVFGRTEPTERPTQHEKEREKYDSLCNRLKESLVA